jgi:Spy/CpxP family protein refolding chaperone
MVNNDMNKMVESLSDTANQIGKFLNTMQSQLTPEQKAELDKALGADGNFAKQMTKAQVELTDAMSKLNNFSKK